MNIDPRITELNAATDPVWARGGDIMNDLTPSQAAQLALYLLDQAGLTVSEQYAVLKIVRPYIDSAAE